MLIYSIGRTHYAVTTINGQRIEAQADSNYLALVYLLAKLEKAQNNTKTPVVGSGTYYCEAPDCDIVQTDEDREDILFYGTDDKMYCQKHLPFA